MIKQSCHIEARFNKSVLIWIVSLLVGASALLAQESTRFPRAWSNPIEGSILSDSTLLSIADEALVELYNMRFESADSIFSIIGNRYPQHPIGPFLKSLTLWWQILPSLSVRDTSRDSDFLRMMDRVIERSEEMQKQHVHEFDAAFFKTAALGFRGRLLSDREQWLSAAQDGKASLDHLFELAEADSTNADLLFGVGVYDFFAEAIQEKYPIVSPLMFFFPSGDKERGLRRLAQAAAYGRFVSAEAAYFLVQIHTGFDPDYTQATFYVRMLRERYPDNALFHLMEGRIYARWGQSGRAESVFLQVIAKYEARASGYVNPIVSQAHYYLGRDAMRRTKYQDALDHFDEVFRLESMYDYDSFFRVHATLRSAMIRDARGERDRALIAYRRVLDMKEHSSSRERARRYMKVAYPEGSP